MTLKFLRRLFTASAIVCISLIVFNGIFFLKAQQSTRQVGTPACEILPNSGQPGRFCAHIRCSTAGYSIPSTNDPSSGCTPTHPRDQSDIFCESPGTCIITERVSCRADINNTGAAYTKRCGNESYVETSIPIICPVTCPGCPTPSGNKPCRRAVWDTQRCVWNTAPCEWVGGGGCFSGFTVSGEKFSDQEPENSCSPCSPTQQELDACWQSGGTYDWSFCNCGQSPVVIDILGNGFNLTNAANGVQFDINGDGTPEQIAWSSADYDDAWLAFDRNDNGVIDNGKELFGNSTAQPAPPAGEMKNGFLALAVFDKIGNGGNADGIISQQDLVFSSLRLWQDTNHNGVSESGELKTLSELGLAKIDLDYHDSRRTDEHGNRFRYRAKVRDVQGAQIGRWAWDVYLVVQPPGN